mmetsp:Transcript_53252/g.158779  ORF Transcript_53252/g.158779 Transcript_53252/m.158779 type:complete len:316 (-) Transcript_53252:2503-3450(-)
MDHPWFCPNEAADKTRAETQLHTLGRLPRASNHGDPFGEAHVGTRGTHKQLELGRSLVHLEQAGSHLQLHVNNIARLQWWDLCKRRQLLVDGAGAHLWQVHEVELDDLHAADIPHVLNGDNHGDWLAHGIGDPIRQAKVDVLEEGVRETVAEGKSRLDLVRDIPTVAEEETLVVPHLGGLARVARVRGLARGAVVQAARPRDWQPPRRTVALPKQDIHEPRDGLLPAEPGRDERCGVAQPRLQLLGAAHVQDNDGAVVRLCHAVHQLRGAAGQRHGGLVAALALLPVVRADTDQRHVRLPRGLLRPIHPLVLVQD